MQAGYNARPIAGGDHACRPWRPKTLVSLWIQRAAQTDAAEGLSSTSVRLLGPSRTLEVQRRHLAGSGVERWANR